MRVLFRLLFSMFITTMMFAFIFLIAWLSSSGIFCKIIAMLLIFMIISIVIFISIIK